MVMPVGRDVTVTVGAPSLLPLAAPGAPDQLLAVGAASNFPWVTGLEHVAPAGEPGDTTHTSLVGDVELDRS